MRLVALLAVGFDAVREAAGAVLLFEGVLLPVGTVLPLALVHPWGRVVPRWVPLLAGRPVPRWLLLGPGLALAVVTTAYFGPAMVEVAVHTFTGTWEAGPGSEPLSFFWVAVPAHLVWGLGLGAGALFYAAATRPACRRCPLTATARTDGTGPGPLP